MKNIRITFMGILFMILITLGCFYTNSNKGKDNSDYVEAKINDSLDVKIFFNTTNNTFSTLIIKNNQNGTHNIYGFHNDGITLSRIGSEKDGFRTGPYYTYYSNGKLNCKVNYIQGEFEGDYTCYSEDGNIIYKANYENGIEKNVEINKKDVIPEFKIEEEK